MTKYLLIAFILLSLALMSVPAIAADSGSGKSTGETKYVSSNPIRDTIDNTPTIKTMQSKKARAMCYTFDVLGNKVPTQTNNYGKH